MTFKLYATLGQYLPEGARDNAVTLEVEPGTSPAAIIERYGLPLALAHLVLVNGMYVPPEERTRPLTEGDVLAIWPPVAGGGLQSSVVPNHPEDAGGIVVHREMGISHADLHRLLGAALGGLSYRAQGDRIVAWAPEGLRVEIRVAPERERRLGGLRLPVTDVELRFTGAARAAVDAFMARFDRAFHKGGG